MLYNLKIKLSSPFLGGVRNGVGKPRSFERDDDKIVVDTAQFHWALKEAAHATGTPELVVSSVRVLPYQPLTINIYRRRWSKEKTEAEEMFESFREGAILTVQIFIPELFEHDLSERERVQGKLPSQADARRLLEFIGKVIGLSPWGSKFGYGRFKVVEFNVAKI